MKLLVLAAAALATPMLFAADDASPHTKGPKPLHISHGAEVNLSDYCVPGKTMVFDFYSEYCPPCRAISPHLETLHEKRQDIDVVKIDINRPGIRGIDWASPVAHEYHLQSIPHFTIVDSKGQVISDGDEAYEKVVGWIHDAEGS